MLPSKEEFESRTKRVRKCLEWQGSIQTRNDGFREYGIVNASGKKLLAHRVSWTIYQGHIPPGMKVLHVCDNSRCVDIDHLFLGTQRDNVHDMFRKGRAPPHIGDGKIPKNAKLTSNEAAAVITMVAAGALQKAAADKFGISRAMVCLIVNGKRWTKNLGSVTHTE